MATPWSHIYLPTLHTSSDLGVTGTLINHRDEEKTLETINQSSAHSEGQFGL